MIDTHESIIQIEVPLSNKAEMLSNAKEALISAYPQIMKVGSYRARLVEYKKSERTLKLTYKLFDSELECRTTDVQPFQLASNLC